MGQIGSLWYQNDFYIAGDFQFTGPTASIRQLQLSMLDILVGADGDFQMRLDVSVASAVLRFVDRIDDFVEVRLLAGRLEGRRPNLACSAIANKEELSTAIFQTVSAPTVNRNSSRLTVSPAGIRHHHRVDPI